MDTSSHTLVECFLRQARSHPQRRALACLQPNDLKNNQPSVASQSLQEWTWLELSNFVHQVAHLLIERGFRSGDHLATWLPNGLHWIVIDLACQLLGMTHVALDRRLPMALALELAVFSEAKQLFVSANDHAKTLETNKSSGVSLCIIESIACLISENNHSIEPIEPFPCQPSTPALMLFTSGTVSKPKGVLLSHGNLISNARAKLAAAPQFETDERLNILPFAHAYGRTCELSTWLLTRSHLTIASDWDHFLKFATQLNPTLANLVPHLVQKLVALLRQADDKVESVLGNRFRLLQVGGAGMSQADWHYLASLGIAPLQGYGLTESSPVICSNRTGDQRCETVGTPVPGVEVRVDEEGILWSRGPHVMLGYWRDQAATQERIVDGWLCTNDVANVHDDGHVQILGRFDDVIVLSNGYKVATHLLGQRLGNHPWIEQLVIVGQGRPYVIAFVYPKITGLPDTLFSGERTMDNLNEQSFIAQLSSDIASALSDLPRWMRVEQLKLLTERLTFESGGLNFKGAMRRAYVEQHLLSERMQAVYDR